MASSEAMTSSTHSFAYSYGLVKKCFLKICETSKFHNFLIFQPIFIRFSLFCSENFTLSSEIKLDQLRTSPLMYRRNTNRPIQNFMFSCWVLSNGTIIFFSWFHSLTIPHRDSLNNHTQIATMIILWGSIVTPLETSKFKFSLRDEAMRIKFLAY